MQDPAAPAAPPDRAWVIGVNFDNTIAGYDQLMHAIAVDRGLIGAAFTKNKKLIRDAVRQLPDGEAHWRGLQVTAYGPRMHEAEPLAGVREFLTECRARRLTAYVVSHKTEFANFGDATVNLRAAATAWLERHGFFGSDGPGLSPDRVFFEPTRAAKIDRIRALGVTHFVDDLEETFLEPGFPPTVRKILLASHGQPTAVPDALACAAWSEVHAHLLDWPDAAALSTLLRQPVLSVVRAGRGGNSQVYCAQGADGMRYAVKRYFQRTMDGRDRLDVEFSSLDLLWRHGERRVPMPVAADRRQQIAVYQYVDGAAIESRSASVDDVDQVVGFAARLKALADSGAAESVGQASEACFSFRALHDVLDRRLGRLLAVPSGGGPYAALREFLARDLVPTFHALVDQARKAAGESAWGADLAPRARTLSPSDFGFHNALRGENGRIVFLDFEYFGWDDPAKMIADFVLHPAMELGDAPRHRYISEMLRVFRADRDLPDRLAVVYPLYALKWCVILLNEFVPKFLERREFAGGADADRASTLFRQLEKARRMLARAREGQRFPLAQ